MYFENTQRRCIYGLDRCHDFAAHNRKNRYDLVGGRGSDSEKDHGIYRSVWWQRGLHTDAFQTIPAIDICMNDGHTVGVGHEPAAHCHKHIM